MNEAYIEQAMNEACSFLYPPQKKITLLYGEGVDKIFYPLQHFLYDKVGKELCYLIKDLSKGFEIIEKTMCQNNTNIEYEYVVAKYGNIEEHEDIIQKNFKLIFSYIVGMSGKLVLNCGHCDKSDMVERINRAYDYLKNCQEKPISNLVTIEELVELVKCPIHYVFPVRNSINW